MPPIPYLVTLGDSKLVIGDAVVGLAPREAALLAFLLTRLGTRVAKPELCELFWPKVSSRRAQHSLSQLLYALRSKVPSDTLITAARTIHVSGASADFTEIP